MTTSLKKEKLAEREPEVVSYPPREPKTHRILIGSALVVVAGLVAIVVYSATRSSQEAPISPPAPAQVLAPVANWTYPEMWPVATRELEVAPMENWSYPEMWPVATRELEVAPMENWSYPEMWPEPPARRDVLSHTEQSGPR